MKVLFVSHHGELGGAERSLLEMLESLRGRGIHRMLACPGSGSLARAAQALEVPVFPIGTFRLQRQATACERARFVWHWGTVTALLVRIIRTHRVDIVHANSTLAQLWAWPAIQLARVPFVWHWRDFYDAPRLNRWLARGRGVSLAVSGSMLRFSARQLGPRHLVVHLANAVKAPCDLRRDATGRRWRREHRIRSEDVLVAALGQAVPRKGFVVLIRAMAIARAQWPGLRGFVACPAADRSSWDHVRELRALIAELDCGIELSEAAVAADEVLGAADVVVVPSIREPFGRTALEAMWMGKPVICSAVDGLEETVVDGVTGVLVPPDEPEPLADAIVALAASPERRAALGIAGRCYAEQACSEERVTNTLLDVYAQMRAGSFVGPVTSAPVHSLPVRP